MSAVDVLDIGNVFPALPNPHRVSVLVSDEDGARLALGLAGNLLGLRVYEPGHPGGFEEQVIELIESDVYTNGVRRWFACPGLPGKPCGTRRRKLYLPPGESLFTCSECHGISLPHAPARPLLWHGTSLPTRVLRWHEPWPLPRSRIA